VKRITGDDSLGVFIRTGSQSNFYDALGNDHEIVVVDIVPRAIRKMNPEGDEGMLAHMAP
jgi:hypothetical protein